MEVRRQGFSCGAGSPSLRKRSLAGEWGAQEGVSQAEPSCRILAEQAPLPDVAAHHLQRAVSRRLVHDAAFTSLCCLSMRNR